MHVENNFWHAGILSICIERRWLTTLSLRQKDCFANVQEMKVMKKSILFLAPLVFVLQVSALDFQAYCNSAFKGKPNDFQIQTVKSQVAFDYNLSAVEIQRRNDSHYNRPEQNAITVGLTQKEVVYAIRHNFTLYNNPNVAGQVCGGLNISADFSHKFMKILIANELKDNSCLMNEIKTHELQHVQYAETILEMLKKEFIEKLQAQFKNEVLFGTEEELENMINTQISKVYLPWLKARYNELNISLNDPFELSEYQRFSTMCNGEFKTIRYKR